MRKPERLSLQCENLDEILGGGLESGVITNVYGESGSGKTNLCVQAVASCLEEGGTVIFIDTEGGLSPERVLQMHDDEESLSRLLMMDPMTFEEQEELFDQLESIAAEEQPDLIVVDSLVALYRLRMGEEDDVSETNRELSRQLSVLSRIARRDSIPVLVTNQVYSAFDSDEVRMVGRDVPTYWSKCLIKLETIAPNHRRAVLKKHRSRPEGLEAEFTIAAEGLDTSDKEPELQLY